MNTTKFIKTTMHLLVCLLFVMLSCIKEDPFEP